MGFDTAGNLINDAAVELGLSSTSDAYASTDANFVRLRTLLKSLGRELWRLRQWTYLQQIHTFITVSGTPRYALPTDFGSLIDQTMWNRTARLPAGAFLSPQEWEYLRAQMTGVTINVIPRLTQNQLWLFPDASTPGSYVLAYEYVSKFWVTPSGTQAVSGTWAPTTAYTSEYVTNAGSIYRCTTPGTSGSYGPAATTGTVTDGTVVWTYVSAAGAEAPASKDDTVLFDSQLVTRGLKLAWKKSSGFDSSAEQADYDRVLEQIICSDTPAPTLNLGGRGLYRVPLISDANIPITGFGS